jgi:RNA recognition motif-containing protein
MHIAMENPHKKLERNKNKLRKQKIKTEITVEEFYEHFKQVYSSDDFFENDC